jgi:hypothetical protein
MLGWLIDRFGIQIAGLAAGGTLMSFLILVNLTYVIRSKNAKKNDIAEKAA